MLPWFERIVEDYENLESLEGGTFRDLSEAHQSLMLGLRTPSGLINKYGKPEVPFAAAIDLKTSCAISSALVGRIR